MNCLLVFMADRRLITPLILFHFSLDLQQLGYFSDFSPFARAFDSSNFSASRAWPTFQPCIDLHVSALCPNRVGVRV